MWKIQELANATFEAAHPVRVQASGGAEPVAIHLGSSVVQLAPVDQASLPICDEQFVRGDQWHLNYPQGDQPYALRLTLGVVANDKRALALECEVSVQTDSLDLHPQLDLRLDGHWHALDHEGSDSNDGGSPRIVRRRSNERTVAILLGPHDFPHTQTLTTDDRTTLRLFGDFLEKGVIRRARPWIVVGESLSDQDLIDRWDQLAASPLPLD